MNLALINKQILIKINMDFHKINKYDEHDEVIILII